MEWCLFIHSRVASLQSANEFLAMDDALCRNHLGMNRAGSAALYRFSPGAASEAHILQELETCPLAVGEK
jgi:hypothetical protein